MLKRVELRLQKRKIYSLFEVISKSVPMMIQDASPNFASVRTPIFTDTLCFKLVNCLQGLIECILLDEHGTVCRRLEAEVPENSNELKWDGLSDLPYGIYT